MLILCLFHQTAQTIYSLLIWASTNLLKIFKEIIDQLCKNDNEVTSLEPIKFPLQVWFVWRLLGLSHICWWGRWQIEIVDHNQHVACIWTALSSFLFTVSTNNTTSFNNWSLERGEIVFLPYPMSYTSSSLQRFSTKIMHCIIRYSCT